jgi:hypothetical protein
LGHEPPEDVEAIDRARFVKLAREDAGAESSEFVYAFEWLQTTHSVLAVNYAELKAIPDLLDGNMALVGVSKRTQVAPLHREYIRRLHNYLASAKTLVDHTRAFRSRHILDEAFNRDHECRVREMRENAVIAFLQEFANPVRHSHLPRVAITTTFPEGRAVRRQMTLALKDLLEMYDWSTKAREYITQAGQGQHEDQRYLDLTAAATEYQEHVSGFYTWFYGAVVEVKRAFLVEFDVRRQELAELQERAHRRADKIANGG